MIAHAHDRDKKYRIEVNIFCDCGGNILFHGEQKTCAPPLEVGVCEDCGKTQDVCFERLFADIYERFVCATKDEILLEKKP